MFKTGETENIPLWSFLRSVIELIFFSFFCRLFFLHSFSFSQILNLWIDMPFCSLYRSPEWWEESGRETMFPHSALRESDMREGERKKDPHNLSASNPCKLCPLPSILLYFAWHPPTTWKNTHVNTHFCMCLLQHAEKTCATTCYLPSG